MSELAAQQFIDDAITAYGHEDAGKLCQFLLASFAWAEECIPMLAPIAGVKLGVGEIPEQYDKVAAQATSDGVVELILDPSIEAYKIAIQLPFVAKHEFAHIAHTQHNPRFNYDARDAGLMYFCAAMREGIASVAEFGICDREGFVSDVSLQKYGPWEKQIIDSLIEILFDPPAYEKTSDWYSFLEGNENFPMAGYKIGTYVVGGMALVKDYSLEQLMSAPFEEYREFAETQL